jgi:Domain of unknown function (DUF1996)
MKVTLWSMYVLTGIALFACNDSLSTPKVSSIEIVAAQNAVMSTESTTLTAQVQGNNGASAEVTWKADAGTFTQSISKATQFTAPQVESDTEVTITATSLQDTTKRATTIIRVIPRLPKSSITAVTVKTDASSLAANATAKLSAAVTGIGKFSTLVNWSIVSGPGRLSGVNSAGASFTAPSANTSSTTVIKATSVQDATKSGTVSIQNAAMSSPSSSYQSNLDRIRAARVRNTNLDTSPYRATPMAALPITFLLGPREPYITGDDGSVPGNPGGNPEAGFPASGVGTFRTACEFSHFAYDDPLVYPNKPGAAHLHMFWGNTDVNAYSTYDTLLNSGSSTCNGNELNRTGYWAPAMFDAQGNVRIPERVIIYYKGYGLANGAAQVYPPKAAMIINDVIVRTPNNLGGAEGEMSFMCSDQYRGDRTPAGLTIPVCDGSRWEKVYGPGAPRSTLEMHVKFPNCWTREDPSKPENWVLARQGGWFYSDCQERATMPNIEYIIAYPLETGETTEGWYLASDVDPTTRQRSVTGGSSIHADWWGAWNPEINKQWIDNCVNLKKDGDHGCGFGYLTDGGPDNDKPLPGPALKFRQQYTGPIKVPAANIYKDLCDATTTLTTPTQAAYCNPQPKVQGSQPHDHGSPAR